MPRGRPTCSEAWPDRAQRVLGSARAFMHADGARVREQAARPRCLAAPLEGPDVLADVDVLHRLLLTRPDPPVRRPRRPDPPLAIGDIRDIPHTNRANLARRPPVAREVLAFRRVMVIALGSVAATLGLVVVFFVIFPRARAGPDRVRASPRSSASGPRTRPTSLAAARAAPPWRRPVAVITGGARGIGLESARQPQATPASRCSTSTPPAPRRPRRRSAATRSGRRCDITDGRLGRPRRSPTSSSAAAGSTSPSPTPGSRPRAACATSTPSRSPRSSTSTSSAAGASSTPACRTSSRGAATCSGSRRRPRSCRRSGSASTRRARRARAPARRAAHGGGPARGRRRGRVLLVDRHRHGPRRRDPSARLRASSRSDLRGPGRAHAPGRRPPARRSPTRWPTAGGPSWPGPRARRLLLRGLIGPLVDRDSRRRAPMVDRATAELVAERGPVDRGDAAGLTRAARARRTSVGALRARPITARSGGRLRSRPNDSAYVRAR